MFTSRWSRVGVRALAVVAVIAMVVSGLAAMPGEWGLAWPDWFVSKKAAAATPSPPERLLAGANGRIESPVMSEDGRMLVFLSQATNFGGSTPTSGRRNLIAWNLTDNTVVGLTNVGSGYEVRLDAVSMSDDGRTVAFMSNGGLDGSGAGTWALYVVDPTNPSSLRKLPFTGIDPAHQINARSLSGDGRYLVFSSHAQMGGASNNQLHVYRYNLRTDPAAWATNIDLVDVLSNGTQSAAGSRLALTNYSGSHVAFATAAANLSTGDTNGQTDAFVRSMATGAVDRLSNFSGSSGYVLNTIMGVADDGSRVVFNYRNGWMSSKIVGSNPAVNGTLFPGYDYLATPGSISADGMGFVGGRGPSYRRTLARATAGGSNYETLWTAPEVHSYNDYQIGLGSVVVSRSGRHAVFDVRNYYNNPKSHLYRVVLDPSMFQPPPAGFANGSASAAAANVMRHDDDAGDPVNTFTGNWWWAGADARTVSPGPSFELARTYNSLDDRVGLFGRGWSSTLDMSASQPASGRVVVRTSSGAVLYFTWNGTAYVAGDGVIGALVNRSGGGWSYTDGNNLRHDFDAQGRIVAVADRNGLTRSYSYDVAGRLDAVTDPSGRIIDVTTDGTTGYVTAVELPDGRATTYTYTSGRLTDVTDMAGATMSFTYAYPGRITEVRGPSNEVRMAVTYDGAGRASSVTDALGRVETFAWNPATRTSTYTDPSGATTVDVYDTAGRLVSQKGPGGGTTTFTWGGGSNPQRRAGTVTDPLGRTTTLTWDIAGRLLSTTNAEGETTSRTYTPAGDLATVTAGMGEVTTFTRDGDGNVTEVTAPQVGSSPSTTTFTPGPDGQPVSVVDPDGVETTFAYDPAGLVESVTDGEGNVTSFDYDTTGRRTAVVDANGHVPGAVAADHTWSTVYDDVDRVTESIDPLGGAQEFTFDALGHLVASEAADGRTATWTYDAMGRVTAVTAPGQGTTSWVFNDTARTATRTDGNGHDVTFTFNAAGQLAEAENELGHTSTWSYDAAGQLDVFTSPTGVTSNVDYDAAGRRVEVTHSDGTPATEWVYDDAGRVVETSNSAQSVGFDYDDQGRVAAQTAGSDTILWTWTPAGRAASRTQPDGTTVTYTYDDAGRVDAFDVDAATIDVTTDPTGAVVGVTYPNGLARSNTFDAAGRLSDLTWTVPGVSGPETAAAWSFTRDSVGRPTSVDRTLGAAVDTVSYDYDAAGRLAAECVGPTGSDCATALDVTEFTFDAVSNMTSRIDSTGTRTNTFDAADRLTSSTDGTVTVSNTFDAAGRLLTSSDGTSTRTWAWDANSKITAMSDGSNTTTQELGPFGLPVAQTDTSGTVSSMWDHTTSAATPALLERDGTSFVSADGSTLLAADVPAVSGPGSDRQWLITDSQGTPVTAVDASGALVSGPVAPTAFGGDAAGTAGLGFLGLPDAADGTADLRARHLDPASGSFLSPDPLNDPLSGAFSSSAPVVSTYVYGYGTPTVFIDPSGLIGWSDFTDAAGSVIGAAGDLASGVGNWVQKHQDGIRVVLKAAASAATFAGMVACGATVVCGVAVGAAAGLAMYTISNAGTDEFTWKGAALHTIVGGAVGGFSAWGNAVMSSVSMPGSGALPAEYVSAAGRYGLGLSLNTLDKMQVIDGAVLQPLRCLYGGDCR